MTFAWHLVLKQLDLFYLSYVTIISICFTGDGDTATTSYSLAAQGEFSSVDTVAHTGIPTVHRWIIP